MTHLIRQLRSWQRREWLYSATVAVAALVLVVAAGVTLACVIDYAIDSERDTPYWVRICLTSGQAVVYPVAAVVAFLFVRAPSLVALAGRAEEQHAEFDHRLVTALQLNRPDARTAGMSSQLIGTVTDEAETLSDRHRLARLADPNRLLYAMLLLLPVVLIAGIAFAFYRPLATALLERQLLRDVDIPRSVTIDNLTLPLHPAGDAVTVRLRVTGRVSDETVGRLRVVYPSGEEQYELQNAGPLPDGGALFTATLPPASEPFTFRARVKDGRMRNPGGVEFAPRPVVTDVAAWVLLPAYVDPDGKRRYETITNQGEVQCHPDCGVRVRATLSKPVPTAELVLSGKGPDRRLPMAVAADGLTAAVEFDLPPGVSGYRIEVADEHGFANLVAPRRGITLLPDRAPNVSLTKELLLPGWEPLTKETEADFDIKGMKLVVGGRVPIGYAARSDLGLSDAFLLYRVKSGEGSKREFGPWMALPLAPVAAPDPAAVGRFRPELGVFEKYDIDKNVEFYRLPSPDQESEPPGRVAGGRYFFETGALTRPLPGGGQVPLAVGDEVELRVAVYDRKPARRIPVTEVKEAADTSAHERTLPGRPAGYSVARSHDVVSPAEFERWRQQHAEARDKLKRLEDSQRGVFDPKKPDDKDRDR